MEASVWKMNRKARAFCISLLLLSTLTFQNLSIVRGVIEEGEIEYYVKSIVTYSNMGDTIWNFTEREEDRTISLFMNNSWQTVYLVNSTPSINDVKTDADGNRIATLQFSKLWLNPGENISYAATYQVVSKPRKLGDINETASKGLNEFPPFLKEKYLGANGSWLVNARARAELESLAYSIAGNETKVLTIVKKLVNWIATNITYKTHEGPLYPNETLLEREGDCDDQAILLITMCRILGIPAFLQIGAIYTPYLQQENRSYWTNHLTVIYKRIGWHGWAMVYIPPWGWLPVDLTYVFGGGLKDNLSNAITNAAVTSQTTIQYMNISQTDYVNSSRKARNFLINNDFYVHMEDEMIESVHQKSLLESVTWVFPTVLIAAGVLLVAGSFTLSRRLTRKRDAHSLDNALK